ncbi:uncharacterized protein LOC106373944 [Brassica napus]|uniref:uncharacterized protein LOC106373944 n=1 Tax=Brassica napus TaxID=3708 RepID=UPI00207919EE|nr:uncharacterized protein LOC106373944 [Brassica napus]
MEFYKAAWPVIGKDLIIVIQSFFLFGFMPHSVNATLLSLIPKTTDAEKMTDFRPIAFYNVIYKVISKILARRLKATLPEAIELNQCAFVEGRLLLENVLLATELVKDYHKPSVSSRSAIKLDISKAFDTVRWSFIESTLRAMNYPDIFVTWIMKCIETATFSVSVNGELEGFTRVLPLSLSLRHHDIVVFNDGTPDSLLGTLQVFEEFSVMSGLRINVVKSTVFAARRGKLVHEDAAAGSGLSTSAAYQEPAFIMDEQGPLICGKVDSYQSCIDEIESMCSAFLWSGSPNITSKAKIAWEDVCCLYAEGGLGIRRIQESDSLWVIWVKRYLLLGETLWDAKDTGLGSWVWRKLLKFRSLAKNFLLMDVKDGATARFWTDLWFPKGRLIEIFGELERVNGDSADVVTDISKAWVHKETVLWSKIVWFPQGVPCFAFITWFAVKDRLPTGHYSRRWGQPQHCLYCGEPDETRDHLFFACPYTFTLWLKMVGNLFGTDPDPDWDITLSTMLSRSYDRLTFIFLRLVLQVTIYFIWRERNDRKHGTSHKTVEQLAKLIDKTVRNRISSTKYTLNPRLQGLMIRWFAAHDTAN